MSLYFKLISLILLFLGITVNLGIYQPVCFLLITASFLFAYVGSSPRANKQNFHTVKIFNKVHLPIRSSKITLSWG